MRSASACAVSWRASPGRSGEFPNKGRKQKEVKALLGQLLSCYLFRVEDTRMELLPELLKLTEDEENAVRLAAFDTIINLMEIMDSGESWAVSEEWKLIFPSFLLSGTTKLSKG